jgi:hypothetical protein
MSAAVEALISEALKLISETPAKAETLLRAALASAVTRTRTTSAMSG